MLRLRDKLATFAVKHSEFIKYHSIFDIAMPIGRNIVKIPVIQGIGLSNINIHEPAISKIIGSILSRRGGTFIDVGANVGQTLLNVLRHDWNRQYVGFDVHPFCCAYVDRLIDINGLIQCQVFPIGLSEQAAAVPLLYNTLHDESSTIVEHFRTKDTYVKRKLSLVERGDDFVQQLALKKISTIKIDVEGGEGSVLLGLIETIRTFSPFIIIEILPISHIANDPAIDPSERNLIVSCRTKNLVQVQQFLTGTSYLSYRILHGGNLEATTDFDMNEFDLDRCNYLLVPPTEVTFADDALTNTTEVSRRTV